MEVTGVRSSRKRVLVIDDNELNRSMLSEIIGDEFEIIEACDGQKGLEVLQQNCRNLSLVVLDVYMPVCDGFEFLSRYCGSPDLSRVPVIVATGSSDPEDEARCLRLGASDFITKPFIPDVVRARIHSIIKLKESVATLSAVEYDSLTGLYTLPAFYHHAQELMASHPDVDFEMSVCDITDLKLLNSIFGVRMGDEILMHIASSYSDIRNRALVARQADKFFCLYPVGDSPNEGLQTQWLDTIRQNAPVNNLKVKVGVYSSIDRSLPISLACDRVLMAASRIKGDFNARVAYYDNTLHRNLLDQQNMETGFEDAIRDGEFVVWFQPKVDAHTERIVAAEALIRWRRKDGELVSPAAFIPLFERDGLISRLDEYVFAKVCEFQRGRMLEGKRVIPISVNMSRNSLYQRSTLSRYLEIVKDSGFSCDLVPIELTESAATEDQEILPLVEQFSKSGFDIHLDDFGTGYSSLSCLASMPFRVIKLDKTLVDNIGKARGEILIRYMVGIARELGMKTVAEGVETRQQVEFLKGVGCDMIQGYYFSPPKGQEHFEALLDA